MTKKSTTDLVTGILSALAGENVTRDMPFPPEMAKKHTQALLDQLHKLENIKIAPQDAAGWSTVKDVIATVALQRNDREQLKERVVKIVVDHLRPPPEKVTEQASFITDLHADSLDNVELIMRFEEEFGLKIPDEDAEKIQTVGAAVDYIIRQC